MTDKLVFRLTPEAQAAGLPLPTKAYANDAAWDLPVYITKFETEFDGWFHADLENLEVYRWAIHTGVIAEIPSGWYGQLAIRSGAADEAWLSGGVIDSGYTGEIKAMAYSLFDTLDDDCLQLLILPIYTLPAYDADGNVIAPRKTGVRGDNGFGSTNE